MIGSIKDLSDILGDIESYACIEQGKNLAMHTPRKINEKIGGRLLSQGGLNIR
jgi:hypothetical protein